MPNIPEYESKAADQGLRPDQAGSEAFAQMGRHAEAIGAQTSREIGGAIADVGKAWENHVTLSSNLDTMRIQADRTLQRHQEWQTAMAQDAAAPNHNPNLLHDLSAKWEQEDNDYVGTLPTVEARTFATEHTLQARQGQVERSAADMASLDVHQKLLNFSTMGNTLTSLAYNDPTAANQARGTAATGADALIEAMGPNASAQAIEAAREQAQVQRTAITLAQGRGTADRAVDPVGGTPGSSVMPAVNGFLSSPEAQLYMTDKQREEVRAHGEEEVRTRTAQATAASVTARKQLEDEGHAAYAQYVASGMDANGAPIPPTPERVRQVQEFAAKYGSVLPAETEGMVRSNAESLRQWMNHDFVQSDPRTFAGLNAAVANGLTHAQVDEAHAQGKLSERDWHDLHESVERTTNDPGQKVLAQQTTEFFASVKGQLGQTDALGLFKDPLSAAKFYRFQSDVQGAITAERARGMTPEDIRKDLLDPASPHYLWGPHQISYYSTLTKAGMSLVAQEEAAAALAARQRPPAAQPAADQQPPAAGGVRIDISRQMGQLQDAQSRPAPPPLSAEDATWLKARKPK